MGTMEIEVIVDIMVISWCKQALHFYCYMYTVLSVYMLRVHMNNIFIISNTFDDVATPNRTNNSFNGPFATIERCFHGYVLEPYQ